MKKMKILLQQPFWIQDLKTRCSKMHLTEIEHFLTKTREDMERNKSTFNDEHSSTTSADIEPQQSDVDDLGSNDLLDFDSCLNDLMAAEAEETVSINIDEQPSSSTSALKLKLEIENYCSLPLPPKDVDVMLWWKANSTMFPELTKIANKMLSSSPSSVESERIFSTGGNIYTPQRNRLNPNTGEKLMLLHFNLRVFNFE